MSAEFDPKSERHFPLMIVKAVEPGCTTELQIEDSKTGNVIRITTTEDGDYDREIFEAAVCRAFRHAWRAYEAPPQPLAPGEHDERD